MINELNEKHSNVLFFTNQCQLDCDYCYEKERIHKTEPFFATLDDFKPALDILAKNDFTNDIIIFGGEPTLCMDEIYKTIKYVNNKYPSKFDFYLNTNCILFSDNNFFNIFKDFYNSNNKNIIITFSYDGSANFRRHYRNSNIDTTQNVIKCINLFTENNIPFNISYCLNIYNYDTCIKDFVYLLQYKALNRIVISKNYNELTSYFNLNRYAVDVKINNDIYAKCMYLYDRFNVPICEMTCNICKKCNKSDGHVYISPDTCEYKSNMKTFDVF